MVQKFKLHFYSLKFFWLGLGHNDAAGSADFRFNTACEDGDDDDDDEEDDVNVMMRMPILSCGLCPALSMSLLMSLLLLSLFISALTLAFTRCSLCLSALLSLSL